MLQLNRILAHVLVLSQRNSRARSILTSGRIWALWETKTSRWRAARHGSAQGAAVELSQAGSRPPRRALRQAPRCAPASRGCRSRRHLRPWILRGVAALPRSHGAITGKPVDRSDGSAGPCARTGHTAGMTPVPGSCAVRAIARSARAGAGASLGHRPEAGPGVREAMRYFDTPRSRSRWTLLNCRSMVAGENFPGGSWRYSSQREGTVADRITQRLTHRSRVWAGISRSMDCRVSNSTFVVACRIRSPRRRCPGMMIRCSYRSRRVAERR